MNLKVSLAGILALAATVSAGCATTRSDPYAYPAASPVTTDAPQIDNADAAGPASVPGTRTGDAPVVVAPAEPAAVIVTPPAPVIVVPPQPR